MNVRIFKINNDEYWAGADVESTIEAACDSAGEAREQYISEPYELPDTEMDRKFLKKGAMRYSFREVLAQMIDEGQEFPAPFAFER